MSEVTAEEKIARRFPLGAKAADHLVRYLSSSGDHSVYVIAYQLEPFFRAAVSEQRERDARLLRRAIDLIPCICTAPGMTCDRDEFVKEVAAIRAGEDKDRGPDEQD